jgi:GNAT superfamily N-acetyltransferase
VTLRIRTGDDADLLTIGALHRRSRLDAYAGLASPVALQVGSAEAMGEWWTERRRWEADTHRLLVADLDAVVAGFAYVGPSDTAGAVELHAVHVEPHLVGAGVGRALMVGALAELTALAESADRSGPDARRAVLWVFDGNVRARDFYVKGGWTADGGRRDAPIGPELIAQVRYSRPLGR